MQRERLALAALLVMLGGALALLGNAERTGRAAGAPPKIRSLRIIAFNTHLLPRIAFGITANRGQNSYRAEAIGPRLVDYDVAGLSEIFDSAYREALIGCLQTASSGAFASLWFPKPRGLAVTNRRIDYVFASVLSDSAGYSLRPVCVSVERCLDPHVAEGTLSDHSAVACELQIRFPAARGRSGRRQDFVLRNE